VNPKAAEIFERLYYLLTIVKQFVTSNYTIYHQHLLKLPGT